MKFYFCETCGKRITETDIDGGLGRDKKLKGVYCKDCAVGVMTMESLPITNEEAHQILNTPVAPPASGVPARKSTSAHSIPAAARKANLPAARGSHGHPSHAERDPPPPASFLIPSVAAALLLVLGLAFLFDRGGRPAPSAAPTRGGEARATSKAPPQHLAPSPPPRVLPPPAPALPHPEPPPRIEPAPIADVEASIEERARLAFERVERFEGLAPDDRAGHVAVLEKFLREHGESIIAARARSRLAEWAAPAAPIAPSAPPVPAPVVQAPAPPDLKPAGDAGATVRVAYELFQNRFLALLRKRDRRAAGEELAQAERNPQLESVRADLARNHKVLEYLTVLEEALPKGALRLRDVEDFELRRMADAPIRIGKRAPFQAVEVKDGKLFVGSKGVSFPVALQDLHPETCGRLMELGFADNAKGALYRAFSLLLALGGGPQAPSPEAVREALEAARKSGAPEDEVAHLLAQIPVVEHAAREALAAERFAIFERLLNEKRWAEAEAAGRKLLEEFGDTATLKAKPDFKDRVSQASRMGAPVKEYFVTLQDGLPLPEAGIAQYGGTSSASLYKFHPDSGGRSTKAELSSGEGNNWYPLFWFAVFERQGSVVPEGAEILEARLFLYYKDNRENLIELRRILSPWNGNEVTWNSSANGVPWKTPGGDLEAEPAASFQAKVLHGTWCEFDVTRSLRDGLVDRKFHGWRVDLFSPDHGKAGGMALFLTDNHPDQSLRPKLTIKMRCARLKGDAPKSPAP